MNRPRALAPLLVAVLLAGCISLFPKEKTSQLYRFGGSPPVAAPPTTPQPTFPVQRVALGFDRAAATDRILAITGNEAAYLRGARWVSGAPILFDQAVARAFDADPGPARLIAWGEAVHPAYLLKLDVRTFEARYDGGLGAPPTIVVEVDAALSQPSDRRLIAERMFTAKVTASENRGGAIVGAFNEAVAKTLTPLVAWVNVKGAS